MKYRSFAVLLWAFLCISSAFAEGDYFQLLKNSHIAEVRVEYSVHEGVSLDADRLGRLLQRSRQAWMLDGQRLVQRASRLPTSEAVTDAILKSKPSQYEYGYGSISFADSTNNLTVLESQMNRVASGNWVPPLPRAGHTLLEAVCPLLGCFVAGNPYMQRYEGTYAIHNRGEELFKGVPCTRYTYSISGPFSTHFKSKGVITEDESDALLKLQQDLTVTGTILVDVVAGIIYARAEETHFKVVEAQRVDLGSKWVTTKEHTGVTQRRSWVVESVTTVYR